MTESPRALPGIGWLLLLLAFALAIIAPPTNAAPREQEATTLYLPSIFGYRPPPPPTIFGAELIPSRDAEVAPLAQEAGVTWARLNQLSWARVEATPGARNWEALAQFDEAVAARSAAGLTNLIIIGEAPVWARQEPGYRCSAIKEEALDDFAAFVREVAARYRRPPFYVNHYEIYNEPDVDPRYGIADAQFGCWGDEEDPYYGGGYYSRMLSHVYPAIKQGNPRAQVIIGGLLLLCDPTHQYPDGRDCSAAHFLRGILREGSGNNFDAVAYHGYPLHAILRSDWENEYALWAHRRGVVLGKLDFIREEMAAFNVDKPVLLTEGALLCYENASCNIDQTLLQQDQANYVVRLYSRALANDIEAVTWYSFNDPGWRYAGMLGANQSTRPAFHALKFMTSRLSRAVYAGTLGDGENGVEGYAFRTGSRETRVYWSNSAVAYPVPLPAGATLFDKVGNPLPPPTTGILLVGFEPVYVVLP